jgi:hypothetical protein
MNSKGREAVTTAYLFMICTSLFVFLFTGQEKKKPNT